MESTYRSRQIDSNTHTVAGHLTETDRYRQVKRKHKQFAAVYVALTNLLLFCHAFAEAVGNEEKPFGENRQKHCEHRRDQLSMMLLKETFQTWQLNKGPVVNSTV